MGQQQVELPIPLTHGPGIGLTIEVFPDSGPGEPMSLNEYHVDASARLPSLHHRGKPHYALTNPRCPSAQ